MNKILLPLALAAFAAAAHAQSEAVAFGARAFETQAESYMRPMAPAPDAFAGVSECGALDMKTIRPWTLREASDLARPCLRAVGAKFSASFKIEAGLISAASSGQPAKAGLILATDLPLGSRAYGQMMASLDRRGGRLLGHPVRLLTLGETAPISVSAVQDSLRQCLTASFVRDIRTGADFVGAYGSCLMRDQGLGLAELRPASGLAVELWSRRDEKSVAAFDGFVTVNAGMGPVSVMVVAHAVKAPQL
jgi:hypothetical protein